MKFYNKNSHSTLLLSPFDTIHHPLRNGRAMPCIHRMEHNVNRNQFNEYFDDPSTNCCTRTATTMARAPPTRNADSKFAIACLHIFIYRLGMGFAVWQRLLRPAFFFLFTFSHFVRFYVVLLEPDINIYTHFP